MYALAKTKRKNPLPLALFHNVLDKQFHNYFYKHNFTTKDHLMLEFYYDCKFKNIRFLLFFVYHSGIIEKTLKKYYKNIKSKKSHVTKIKLLAYYLLKEIQKDSYKIFEKKNPI